MEKLVLERNPGEPLRITLTTELGGNATLVITKVMPLSSDLGQMQVLQLQADLMQEALKQLQQKLDHTRRIDSQGSHQA